MISNQQVIEQAKSVLTPTVCTSKEDYFRIDTTLKHMIEYTHVWNDADAYQATAYRFLECWCYIYTPNYSKILKSELELLA